MPVGGHIIRKKALGFTKAFEITYFEAFETCNKYNIIIRKYDIIFRTISVEERPRTADICWEQTRLSKILS